MQYSPGEFEEILNIFKAESEEIVQEINDNFLLLEKNPADKTPVKRLLQLAHSLKGAARMLGFNGVQNIAHKIEDILSFFNTNGLKINPAAFEPLYKACDFILLLINNCTQNKADYKTPLVDETLKNLDDIFKLEFENLPENEGGAATKIEEPKKLNKEESEKYISDKQTDINAILLEMIFVSDKDDDEDKNEVLTVIREKLTDLKEIFAYTVYEDILNKIAKLLEETKSENFDFGKLKNEIFELKNENSSLFSAGEKNAEKPDPAAEAQEKSDDAPGITWQFNDILNNLSKIREHGNYINTVYAFLNELNTCSKEPLLKSIVSKTAKVLGLFIEKSAPVDKDCYMVILQSIYLAKRIYMQEEGFEHINTDFTMQRLSLVEDMLNVSQGKQQNDEINETAIITSDEYFRDESANARDIREIKTIRTDSTKLDYLVTRTGELLVNGIRTRKHLSELSKISEKVTQGNAQNKKILNYIKYLEKRGFFSQFSDEGFNMFFKRIQSFLTENAQTISTINNDITELYSVISEDDNKLHQTAVEIDTVAKGIRVLPLATIFHSFPRMVRDIAKENNKKVDFVITGSDTTVDKKIIEEIKMPLIHILRNSVSHGIEPEAERRAKNKNETGKITLNARQAENYVYITVEDDGYGINLEKVKEAAVSKGLLYPDEAETLNKEQIVKLLFIPGFSTQTAVSEISGRGVGLDIVKTKIANLNGDISVDSEADKGCKITIKLPLTMSMLKVFIILAGSQKYAIPVSSIKCVKTVKYSDIYEKNGKKFILFDSHSVPIVSLSEILFDTKKEYKPEDNITVIIAEEKQGEIAAAVDELLCEAEVFGKKLINPILKIKNISGFTTLEDGEICLIINTKDLINNVLPDNFSSHKTAS